MPKAYTLLAFLSAVELKNPCNKSIFLFPVITLVDKVFVTKQYFCFTLLTLVDEVFVTNQCVPENFVTNMYLSMMLSVFRAISFKCVNIKSSLKIQSRGKFLHFQGSGLLLSLRKLFSCTSETYLFKGAICLKILLSS